MDTELSERIDLSSIMETTGTQTAYEVSLKRTTNPVNRRSFGNSRNAKDATAEKERAVAELETELLEACHELEPTSLWDEDDGSRDASSELDDRVSVTESQNFATNSHETTPQDDENSDIENSMNTKNKEDERTTEDNFKTPESEMETEEDKSAKASVEAKASVPAENLTPIIAPEEKPLPNLNQVLVSTEMLFSQVTDKATVTVKDILASVTAEYDCGRLPKQLRIAVRERLQELALAETMESQEAESIGQAEASDEETEAPEESDQEQDSDDDYQAENDSPRKKPSKRKKKEGKMATSRQQRRKSRAAAAKVKAAALRVHTQHLRKRRLHELRVRNEELQMHKNEQDQKRAELIAAKFDTNTDEQLSKRLEQRIDLWRRLDQKRMTVIHMPKAEEDVCGGLELAKGVEDDFEKLEYGVEDQPILVVESFGKKSRHGFSDTASDSEDDMELEVVGERALSLQPQNPSQSHPKKFDAMSMLATDGFGEWRSKKSTASPNSKSRGARAALRSRLKAKHRQMGNRWLAQELGYKSEHEHLQDCMKVEQQKLRQTILREKERLKEKERILKQLLEFNGGIEEAESEESGTEQNRELTTLSHDEEDEEMILARTEREASAIAKNHMEETRGDEPNYEHNDTSTFPSDKDELETDRAALNDGQTDEIRHVLRQIAQPSPTEPDDFMALDPSAAEKADKARCDPGILCNNAPEHKTQQYTDKNDAANSSEEGGTLPDRKLEREDPALQSREMDGPRNAAWRAMLAKEAEKMKRMKKRKGGLIEEEADEEEEEDVAGLEDFGFIVRKKKRSEDDDDDCAADELDEDDLKDIVDDLSDDEGDEEAGKIARKQMQMLEERIQHKEMMRKIREGYDGRRGGGIAGGASGARGLHRFEELVAADNRESAERNGLLNDDEIDNGDEAARVEEEEDENALLDKMLKDRFLHRSTVDLEENFSDDEDEEGEIDGSLERSGEDIDEKQRERQQDRLAKRFEKRARMQRLLDEHGDLGDFSRSRLIDDDESLQVDLSKMKNGLARKRFQSCIPSKSNSTSNFTAQSSTKRMKTTSKPSPSFAFGSGALAIALQASRRSKSRTCFALAGSTGLSEASFQKNVALNHVVFSSSRNSQPSKKSSTKEVAATKRHLGPGAAARQKTRNSVSLWSKAVIEAGFQKRA